MSDKHTIKRSAGNCRRGHTDWAHVDALTEDAIEAAARSDPDAQPTTAEFWQQAVLRLPEPKQAVSLRLDRDVLAWYKRQGRGYQTRINAVLRAYMEAQQQAKRPDRPDGGARHLQGTEEVGMNRADLVGRMAQAADLTQRQSEKALDALLDGIQETLRQGERITLVGFGTFAVRSRAARTGRNPRTGQALTIPARKTPTFKAGKRLREAVR